MTIAKLWPAMFVALALGLTLAGCVGELPATMAPQPAPPNYARMAGANFAGTLPKQPLAGASISAIQPTVAPQPGDWFACFKFASGEYYAVFYAEGKVTEARNAVALDRCATAEGYAPLPPPEKPKPTKPAKSKKGEKR